LLWGCKLLAQFVLIQKPNTIIAVSANMNRLIYEQQMTTQL